MKHMLMNLQALILSYKSKIVKNISKILFRNMLKISTAESCTGGLISSRLTDIDGSSAFVHANFVTYSNEAKQRLKNYGAVSEQCAREMALGLLKLTNSDIVLCTTGVAGPTGSENKPVGLMYAACGYNNNITVKEFRLNQNYSRKNMKFMFSEEALNFVYETISK